MAESQTQEQNAGQNNPAERGAGPSAREGSTHTQRTVTTSNTVRRPESRYYPSKRSKKVNARPNNASRNNTYQESETPPNRPQFSLAGNQNPGPHAPSYVEQEYYDLNPNYQKPKDTPLWGLAKPLPRVVRPGMRKGGRGNNGKRPNVVENKRAENDEPGGAEAIPQLGMIGSQREDDGKSARGTKNQDSKNQEDRGYGHQQDRGRRRSYRSMNRQESDNRIFDRYGTPLQERNDPMDEWASPQSPFEDGGDLAEQRTDRLSDVQEYPSRLTPQVTTQSDGFANQQDSNDVDLEAGDKLGDDEWSLDSEEAEHYIREERDNFNTWANIRSQFREPFAECLATMIAVLIGISTNLAVQTSNESKGDYQSTNWAWGFGITIGVYVAGGISGGHLNPAISLSLCIYRGFPIRKACVYILAQILGGFFAGLIAYGIYKDAIASYDATGGQLASGTVVSLSAGGSGVSFYTQPATFATPTASFFNEFVATGILSCAILALGDDSNAPPGAGMHALIVGLLVTVLTMAFGYTTGACLNPARDFGPRLATAAVGYGSEVFTVANAWWIYGAWGATVSGALVGGFFYDTAIFVGGESPVNYPRNRRKQARKEVKENTTRRWSWFKREIEAGTNHVKNELKKEG